MLCGERDDGAIGGRTDAASVPGGIELSDDAETRRHGDAEICVRDALR